MSGTIGPGAPSEKTTTSSGEKSDGTKKVGLFISVIAALVGNSLLALEFVPNGYGRITGGIIVLLIGVVAGAYACDDEQSSGTKRLNFWLWILFLFLGLIVLPLTVAIKGQIKASAERSQLRQTVAARVITHDFSTWSTITVGPEGVVIEELPIGVYDIEYDSKHPFRMKTTGFSGYIECRTNVRPKCGWAGFKIDTRNSWLIAKSSNHESFELRYRVIKK